MAEQDAVPAPAEAEELVLDDTPAEAESDEAELEIGPTKYKVPKAIKDGWSGLQNSTREEKIALQKRADDLTKREAAHTETERVRSAFMDEVAEIKGIDKQLEPYLKLTPAEWMAWAEQDGEAARKAQVAVNALQMQRAKVLGQAQTKANDLDTKAKQTAAERAAAAEKELPLKIKDWSPAKKEALIKVAIDNGLTADEIAPLATDARVMSILDKAAKYDAAVARAAKVKADAVKADKDAAPEPEPTAKLKAVGGNTSVAPRDSDSPEAWLRKRQAQVKRQGGRI